MPKAEKIKRNAARCLLCNDVVESKSCHDFRTCKCGNLFVDGGCDYLRRGAREGFDTVEDLCEFETVEVPDISEMRGKSKPESVDNIRELFAALQKADENRLAAQK